MDLLIKLTRPDDYSQDQGARFLVTFDKCRSAYGSGVAPFLAHLTPGGWLSQGVDGRVLTVAEKLLEYVRLADQAGGRPKSANAAITGARVRREAGLRAWSTLVSSGAIVEHPEGGFCVP